MCHKSHISARYPSARPNSPATRYGIGASSSFNSSLMNGCRLLARRKGARNSDEPRDRVSRGQIDPGHVHVERSTPLRRTYPGDIPQRLDPRTGHHGGDRAPVLAHPRDGRAHPVVVGDVHGQLRARSPVVGDESIRGRPAASRSSRATRAPRCARRRATAAPMPEPVPVTTAISSDMVGSFRVVVKSTVRTCARWCRQALREPRADCGCEAAPNGRSSVPPGVCLRRTRLVCRPRR